MIEGVFFLGGLLIGGLVAWLWAASRARGLAGGMDELRRHTDGLTQQLAQVREALDQEKTGRVAAETRLKASAESMAEQRALLSEAEKKLKDAFAALSAEALKNNTETFAKQTEEKVKPLKEALEKYEKQIKDLETAREGAYKGIKAQLDLMGTANQKLQDQTMKLVTALRAPQVRGRWGEITLQRVVEFAGMSAHCDFVAQPSTETDDGRRRPDLIVTLPGGRTVVVDAKTPLADYLNATEASDEEARRTCLRRHAAAVRGHMQDLSSKTYWNQFESTPDFVVMFLPGESFFSAALENDRGLIEDGIRSRVILATPTTLIALLQTVAYTWQQQEVAENTQQIADAARELYERILKYAEHFSGVGESLQRATASYNKAIASWQSRVLPAGRRVAELGPTSKDEEFPELKAVEAVPLTPPSAA